MQAIAAILRAKKGSFPVLLAFLAGGPPTGRGDSGYQIKI